MPKLNPQEAPPGFIAQEAQLSLTERWDSCAGCHFLPRRRVCPFPPTGVSCLGEDRQDRNDVIYVKDPNCKETQCPKKP